MRETVAKDVIQISQSDTVNPCQGCDKSQVSLLQGHCWSAYHFVLYIPKDCLELKVN